MIYEPIRLDPHSSLPMYRQLYDSIRGFICDGSIPVGERLPSIRKISRELGVSRTTVEQAYQQLCVEGYISSRPQSGYFVEAALEGGFGGEITEPSLAVSPDRPLYDFGSGYVDSRSSDINLWRKYVRAVLTREETLTSYGHYQGEPELRAQLVTYSSALRGVRCTADRIVIGAGVQPLLSLLCGLLGDKAGRIGMECPLFPQAERIFSDFRLNIVALGHDKFGVTPDELYSSKADMLYINPSNTESVGRPMPISRRTELMEWADKTHGLIIEDDYNGALRFLSRPAPSLQGMGNGSRVVYLGSFSKLLMPSVRISYMVLPPKLAELYAERGFNYNQTSSKTEQLALAEYIHDGHIEKRLRRLRKLYSEKSQIMLDALDECFGERAEVFLAETALSVRVKLRSDALPRDIAKAALKSGVRIIPPTDGDNGEFSLSFSGIPAEKIRDGIAALAIAIS